MGSRGTIAVAAEVDEIWEALQRLRTRIPEVSDDEAREKLRMSYEALRKLLLDVINPEGAALSDDLNEIVGGAQSKIFMMDLFPKLARHLIALERGTHLSVADVGCGTGHGANLLGSLFRSNFLGYTMDVTAIDIDEKYHEYIKTFCWYVNHRVVDIHALQDTYDFVICSHTIEHVNEPEIFVRQLQRIARRRVFLVAPFEEKRELLTVGHVNIFGMDFIDKIGGENTALVESFGWGSFLNPRYKMFITELPPIGFSNTSNVDA